MEERKIFVFEFISGGGFNQQNIPSSLFCEGFGMLKSIIADFKSINFNVSTLLDYRIFPLSKYLNADVVDRVDTKKNYVEAFSKKVKDTNFCFVIAPEFSNILYDLTNIAKKSKKVLLSVDLKGIKIGTSKSKNYAFFIKNQLKTPQTWAIPFKNTLLDSEFIIQKFKELKKPLIIKPDDGVGAEAIYYFGNLFQINFFFKEHIKSLEKKRRFLAQEFIEGKDLSVSLIGLLNNSKDRKILPMILGVNSQNISIKSPSGNSEYLGGYTPDENYLEILSDVNFIFQRTDFSNFSGYFGIDFVRMENKTIYFIEINPRLTTSYIGIRNIIDKNPVELIINAKLNPSKCAEFSIRNFSKFTKLELKYIGNKTSEEFNENIVSNLIREIPELVTPPILFDDNNLTSDKKCACFIATKTKDLTASNKRILEITNFLKKYDLIKSKVT